MSGPATTRPSSGSEPRETGPSGLKIGSQLGRYVIVRTLAAGGNGELFVAFDPVLDRNIALKVLLASMPKTAWAREAQLLARVAHGSVVTVHDAGVHDGRGFVAMEGEQDWTRSEEAFERGLALGPSPEVDPSETQLMKRALERTRRRLPPKVGAEQLELLDE